MLDFLQSNKRFNLRSHNQPKEGDAKSHDLTPRQPLSTTNPSEAIVAMGKPQKQLLKIHFNYLNGLVFRDT
jgi:hypothetical protein